MRMKLFEDLTTHTELSLLRSYQLGEGLMVKFNIKKPAADSSSSRTVEYGYDLYDFDDHFFRSSNGFTTLEDAKWAALASILPDQRQAA